MRVSSFEEIEAEFIERAHHMVWCDMATVGPDGHLRTRIVQPVWASDTAWMTSLRVGSKADDIDRNPFVVKGTFQSVVVTDQRLYLR